MTISPPESGEKDKKILESPVKADPRPIDFAKLDKPGFWSSKLSKGPKTTTWIWNLHADAHDFDVHTGDAEEATRKIFSAHFGHLAVIFIWMSAAFFHGARFSNYSGWLADPTHVKPGAQQVWAIVGQEMLNGDLGANYNGIQISSGIFHMWRAWGITNESELMALAIGAVVMAALMLHAGIFHYHKAAPKMEWFQDVESMMNHHLAGLLGLGSLAWAGHTIHIGAPTAALLDAIDAGSPLIINGKEIATIADIPMPHQLCDPQIVGQIFPGLASGTGNNLWKTSEAGNNITQLSEKDSEQKKSIFHISIFGNHKNTWHPPTLWIGLGCERNTSKELIEDSLQSFLASNNLSPLSIAGFATVDLKKDEKAFLEISKEKNLPIKFFTSLELSKINTPNPSNVVLNEIGTPSVAEAACIMAAGEGSKLLKEKKIFKSKESSKIKSGAVTIAIAESKNQYSPLTGEIHVIGSGPGDISYLTNDARKALSKCSIWIGYKMYLDLIKPLKRKDQVLIESNLTEERERCEKAIKLAEEGIKIALISSGDSGFYGMAGLLLELIQKVNKDFRPSFEVHPGISSMQLAAALGGAPLMNDFCSISLSDKLTPWESIEKRIAGALLGDFVIAIFNPQSLERNWQLKRTIELCLEYRLGDTPVLVGRQVGRENQSKSFFNLDSMPLKDIDMLSIIIIGNSKTTLIDEIFLTPRGYLKK